jgi:RHS repeat-associated protein
MAARLTRLLVALGLLLGAALPSAAAALVRLPTSQETAASPVPARRADPAYARSYFGARYYRADVGRFTTVDPELNVNAALLDPQRWNRYAYVRNNPLRYTDPDGKDIWDFLSGIGNALSSNALLGAGRTSGNRDFVLGQRVGDVVSLVGSAIETTAGSGMTVGGVAACGTGVGCLVGAPAVAEGATLAGHGVGMGAAASISLMKSFSDDAGGGSAGNFRKATDRQLQGVDAHSVKEEYVGSKNISKWNISVDSKGQVVLTPVRKGTSEVRRTGLTLDELRTMFPKQ